MKSSDVIFKWKRAEIWTRFLFFLFSVIFHVFFVYCFYTAKFDIKEVKVERKIIEIRPIEKELSVFPVSKKKISKNKQNILNHNPIKTPPGYETGDEEFSQIHQKPLEEKGSIKKGDPRHGKRPGIQKNLAPPRERLKAPFNPSKYLKPEIIKEILRDFEKEKTEKGMKLREAREALEIPGSDKNIVVDYEGKAYFKSKGFDFTPWAQKVVARINENWFVLPGFKIEENSVVGIVVIFDKYGEVVSAKITRPSDVQPLDHSALNAIKLSTPYPHLPEQFPGDQLKAFFLFNFTDD